MTDHQRLARLLGGDELAWLLTRVRRRMERGEPLDTSVTLSGATAEQRAAAHRLLGRRPRPGETLTVSLPAVDHVVRHSGACPDGLAVAVVALTGPVADRTTERAELERSWQRAFTPLEAVVERRPGLVAWYERIRATGLVRRLAGTPESAESLLGDLAEVIRHLPAHGEPLGRFAARVARSAHALDDDRPLATLSLGAARALSGLSAGTGAEWRREVWASVGLLRDELSTTVLTLGFPGDDETATGRALAAWHGTGQPVVLTLRQLVRDPPRLDVPRASVCENPVVASTAAQELGPACTPLVCTSGQPGAAVMHLLRLLTAAGAGLRYHGDFDWGGLHIGNLLFDRFPVRPWRFETTAYRSARLRGRELTGSPVQARWDPSLGAAMTELGDAVEEEHIIDDLLTDLSD
ncbi:MAG: TIGR02679 family protein [Streptosporangiales bacterium]|nr:TIGR02679 family protein [Streptosporangiales bacterium]